MTYPTRPRRRFTAQQKAEAVVMDQPADSAGEALILGLSNPQEDNQGQGEQGQQGGEEADGGGHGPRGCG